MRLFHATAPRPTPPLRRPCCTLTRQTPLCRPPLTRPTVKTMVKTESVDLAIGEFQLPDFELPVPATGGTVSSADLKGKVALVMFICVHCPFVVLLKDEIKKLADDYIPKGVAIVAISSNSPVTHPQDGPDAIKAEVEEKGYPFAYAYDGDTGAVAKSFRAACTPDLFVFAADGTLAYHGQFDDARPGNGIEPTGADLRAALDDVLAGRKVQKPIKKSIGCNVKWAEGNEPSYFSTGMK